jgi:cob(I)alamin adenosyltransferase
MVKLNKIYTKTGDKGDTGLATGERRAKSDVRIEAYGTVDETNATLGLARLHTEGELDAILARAQNDLFDLGADLATPAPADGTPLPFEALRVTDAQVERLEREIDQLNADLDPLESFILPGGNAAATYLHLARTVCRRAERLAVALAQTGEVVGDPAIKYLNRLSDLLFVAARVANDGGKADVLWVPGGNRE